MLDLLSKRRDQDTISALKWKSWPILGCQALLVRNVVSVDSWAPPNMVRPMKYCGNAVRYPGYIPIDSGKNRASLVP